MRKVIFRIRELVWWLVAELEDILYPYTDDYDNHVYASRSPEIDDISELRDITAFEKIERLQSEMIHVQNTQRRQEMYQNLNDFEKALRDFGIRVETICAMELAGKLDEELSYKMIKEKLKELKKIRKDNK